MRQLRQKTLLDLSGNHDIRYIFFHANVSTFTISIRSSTCISPFWLVTRMAPPDGCHIRISATSSYLVVSVVFKFSLKEDSLHVIPTLHFDSLEITKLTCANWVCGPRKPAPNSFGSHPTSPSSRWQTAAHCGDASDVCKTLLVHMYTSLLVRSFRSMTSPHSVACHCPLRCRKSSCSILWRCKTQVWITGYWENGFPNISMRARS